MGELKVKKKKKIGERKKERGIETPQGQSDSGRNPKPLLVPEPLQEHETKAPFPSKIKLPPDWILFQYSPKSHHSRVEKD